MATRRGWIIAQTWTEGSSVKRGSIWDQRVCGRRWPSRHSSHNIVRPCEFFTACANGMTGTCARLDDISSTLDIRSPGPGEMSSLGGRQQVGQVANQMQPNQLSHLAEPSLYCWQGFAVTCNDAQDVRVGRYISPSADQFKH